MKNKFLFAVLMTIFCSILVLAQSIITNENVIEMVKSGLSAEVIKAKIKSSEINFDTSTEALKKLSEANVPESVVVAMIEQEQSQKQNAKQEKKDTSKVSDSIPEQGKLSDIVGKKKAYIFTTDLKARDIIIKEIGKKNSLEIVDKLEDSDFAIKYESWEETVNVTASAYGNTATARENKQTIGLLTILMPSLDENSSRIRFVYSTKKSKYFIWENNPAESTTKQFIKDLFKAQSH